MSKVSNRDVVLGMMAVQLGVISRETLAAALRECRDDPDASLGDLLLETGILNDANHVALESAADSHVDEHGNAEESLAGVGLPSDVIDADGQVNEASLIAALDQPELLDDSDWLAETIVPGKGEPPQVLDEKSDSTGEPAESDFSEPTVVPDDKQTGPSADHSESLPTLAPKAGRGQSSSAESESVQRYHILRPHAEGGLGQVLVALDKEVNRQVAFKQIKPRFSHDVRSRARFLVEAEVTGRLEHPGIVPVYGLGAHEDGRPFYAMRFIRGQSLRAAIRDFHAARRQQSEGDAFDPSALTASDAKPQTPLPLSRATTVVEGSTRASGQHPELRSKPRQIRRRPLAGDLEFRSLIHRLIDVCNTMAYAHSKGVLHRDLKPANIMLGAYGETLIVDWGLAKVQGERQVDDQYVDRDASLMEPVSGSGSAPTMLGSVIGTPMFMSPEQAQGRVEELGPATDIYSIGATLYELITGHSPMFGQEAGSHLRLTDLLQRVRNGQFQPPRQVNPDVPQALEAICLKSMAHEPEDRYSSARAMAVDLEAWMADEPVTAWDDPWYDRLRRWISRHRLLVSSIAAAVTVGLIISVVAFIVVSHSRDQERLAREDAVRRFSQARAAIDTSLTGISEGLQDQPELQSMLLEQAAEQYTELIKDHSDDPVLQLESARAMIRLGYVRMTLWNYEDALAAAEDAIGLLGRLADDPGDLSVGEVKRELARSHLLRGLALHRANPDSNEQSSRASFMESLAILESIPGSTGHELSASDWLALGEVRIRLAEALRQVNERDQALELLGQALTDFDHEHPPSMRTEFNRGRALAFHGLGDVQFDLGENAVAAGHARDALEIWSELVREEPNRPEHYDGRATALILLTAALDPLTDEAERNEVSVQTIADVDALAAAFPNSPRYQYVLAAAGTNQAAILHQRGLNLDATDKATGAIDLLEVLLLVRPEDRKTQAELAAALTMRGWIQFDLNQIEPALADFTDALSIYDELKADETQGERYLEDRAVCLSNMARVLHRAGQTADAAKMFDEAIAAFQRVAEGYESPPEWLLQSLAFTHVGRADLRLETGNAPLAATDYSTAASLVQGAIKSPGARLRLAMYLCHCPDETVRNPERAQEIANEVRDQFPVAAAWSAEGAALVRLERWGQAISALQNARDNRDWMSVHDEFLLAIALWQRNAGEDRVQAAEIMKAATAHFLETQSGRRETIRLHTEAATLIP